jgi:hypothetical protein
MGQRIGTAATHVVVASHRLELPFDRGEEAGEGRHVLARELHLHCELGVVEERGAFHVLLGEADEGVGLAARAALLRRGEPVADPKVRLEERGRAARPQLACAVCIRRGALWELRRDLVREAWGGAVGREGKAAWGAAVCAAGWGAAVCDRVRDGVCAALTVGHDSDAV